ncbi:MAG: DsbA family protein [Alphaproteobacteria bacterium]
MKRRNILLGAAAGGIAALAGIWLPPGPVRAEEMAIFEDDRILGSAEAPITIIEYSSLTCPHCAAFHADALPQIKETWIADGRVRLVYRHFPLDAAALRAAAVANCIEGARYFGFLDLLFKSQRRWAKSKDPLKELGQMARLAGMSQEKFEACANDESEMDRILQRQQDGVKTYEVQSTPTLIVNGTKVSGARSFEHLENIFKKIVPES